MHPYSIDSLLERNKILFSLALFSFLLVAILPQIYDYFNLTWVSVPSSFFVFGLLYTLFDRFIWKLSWLARLRIVQTPYINGNWEGELRSSQDNFKTPYKVTVTVHQTWSKISIYLEGVSSKSESRMAMITNKNPTLSEIEWSYLAKYKPEYTTSDHIISGVTCLTLDLTQDRAVKNNIEGSYYTEKSQYYGKISLTKVN